MEVVIARYASGFLRHTIGDVIAPILVYCFIKSFTHISVSKALIVVLLISFAIEFLQLSNLQNMYPKNIAYYLKIILGTSFDIGDLIAYTLGLVIVYVIEKINHQF
ncbi:DUF2809 domain-containing protein [Polaribacter sp. WD7]|uniref:ribosomal maturation YjgA family protein n=1 Tax=Polaribacter sp. WD7 TaxID=2269061 RepID=UPI0015F04220|nr:DUF2809 domain-containing protein [Polaribacter sp. WD7]